MDGRSIFFTKVTDISQSAKHFRQNPRRGSCAVCRADEAKPMMGRVDVGKVRRQSKAAFVKATTDFAASFVARFSWKEAGFRFGVRFWEPLFRGHPGRIGSFLSLVPALFQDLFSGLDVLFARQGPFFSFALSDASDPIRCIFNRYNPDNLHEAVQQRLRGKRIVHFGREQSVVGCQRDECIDDQHQGLRFPLPVCISEVFPGDQN